MSQSLPAHWNAWAAAWSGWVVSSLIGTLVVLGIVSLVWLIVRRKAPPQLGYFLFLLVPLKLLVPFEMTAPGWIARWSPHAAVERAVGGHESTSTVAVSPRIAATSRGPLATSPIIVSNSAAEAVIPRPVESPLPQRSEKPSSISLPSLPVSMSALLMSAWMAIMIVLMVRLIMAQVRFRARLTTLDPPPEGVRELIDQLRNRMGLRPLRTLVADDLASPAVCGILWPTVLIPRAMLDTLSAPQLEWVLLHELAHIRRHDLAVSAFQRLVGIVQFWNPAIWVANRAVNRLREYACDDVAASLATGSRVDSGEAFMNVVRFAAGASNRLKLNGALGVFEAEGKASCFARMSRLLDTERRLKVKLGIASIGVLALTGILALPQIRAANEPEKNSKTPPVANAEAPAKQPASPLRFALTVVDPEGKPVPNASVEIRPQPMSLLEGAKFTAGTKIRDATYGPMTETSSEGVLAIEFAPGELSYIAFNITTDGYAPFWAQWNPGENSEPVPDSYTAHLDAGVSLGSIIVNEEGQPIEGVSVHPSIEYKKRETDLSQLAMGGSKKTDAEGKWAMHFVPAAKDELSVELSHPEYMPAVRRLSTTTFRLEKDAAPKETIVLPRGLTVTGKVVDQTGAPIAGAVIRTKFVNDHRQATTGEDGVYKLLGCGPQRASLVVTAKGFGPDVQEVQIEPELPPVDFTLGPGKTLRVRIMDEQGKPLPKSRIFFRSWRSDQYGYGLDKVHAYTDENGVWEWTDAPADAIVADICPADGMQVSDQTLIARDEEYVYTRIPELHIEGSVVDKATKEPIKAFRVITGWQSQGRIFWDRDDGFDGADGKFRLAKMHPTEIAHVMRIETNGYLPAVSRNIANDEGRIHLDFELERGRDVVVAFRTPDGKPGADADVAIGIAGSQINIRDGHFQDRSTYCDRKKSNAQGQLSIPPQLDPYELVVIHPAGYAHVKVDPQRPPKGVTLQAWSRVEGKLHVGTEIAANVPLSLKPVGEQYGPEQPSIGFQWETRTDAEGRFSWDRVIPGPARIHRRVDFNVMQTSSGSAPSHLAHIDLPPGRTKTLELGGLGRPITGTLRPPENLDEKFDWNFCLVTLTLAVPELPAPPVPPAIEVNQAQRTAWMEEWKKTPEGRAWFIAAQAAEARQSAAPYYYAAVNRDGTFRLDDIPAEDYELSVRLEEIPQKQFRFRTLGFIRHHFAMPEIPGGRADTPLDLGTLTLQKSE